MQLVRIQSMLSNSRSSTYSKENSEIRWFPP